MALIAIALVSPPRKITGASNLVGTSATIEALDCRNNSIANRQPVFKSFDSTSHLENPSASGIPGSLYSPIVTRPVSRNISC
jgi:hypothetical protein